MNTVKQPTPLINLVDLCRCPDVEMTEVTLHWGIGHEFVWLDLAQTRLLNRGNSNYPGVWVLDAYLRDRTDFENSSAFILSLELIGVEFQGFSHGRTEVRGYINPDSASFHVPPESYNPTELDGSAKYLPPHNKALYDNVKGKRVTIVTGIP